jgi:hypothetical protein
MTKTYTFSAELMHYEMIEVEADSYDEAYDLAMDQANSFDVYHPDGYTVSFQECGLVDMDIPEED